MSEAPLFSRTTAAVQAGLDEGLHIGAQWYVSRQGRVLCDAAVGEAAPGVPMRSDTLMLWLSSSKPIAAAAIMQLREQGRIDLDDAVARHLPTFGFNGKQCITVRHLLTHTGGFRFVGVNDPHMPWDVVLHDLCAAPREKDWIPGARAGYHPYTSWFVLGELVARCSGLPYMGYVKERIFEPLGMTDCRIGMSEEDRQRYGDRLGILVNMEKPERPPHIWSTPAGVTACVPGANGHGPVRQLAKFYEMLLGGGMLNGTRLLSPESVRALTTRERIGMFDETFKHTLDWTVGLIPNNRRYGLDTVPYGYGRHASDGAFGHSGSQSSAAFADPEHQLVVAVVFNGTCGERRHQARIRTFLDALYEDLQITRSD